VIATEAHLGSSPSPHGWDGCFEADEGRGTTQLSNRARLGRLSKTSARGPRAA